MKSSFKKQDRALKETPLLSETTDTWMMDLSVK
jgi:hypothetical protein